MQQDKERALFIAKKLLAELVFDVQKLEGMPFTLPEVQTYLQGITVGGHKVSDEAKLQQQILGWEMLIDLVRRDAFSLDKATACSLQAIVAKEDAPHTMRALGVFRDGPVGIAGTDHTPPAASDLDAVFEHMVSELLDIQDLRQRAYRTHLDMARNQFFFDGNKRTGLLMAGGLLMSNGYAPLSIPAKRQTEYNAGMLRFYDSGDPGEMVGFLRQCHEGLTERFS